MSDDKLEQTMAPEDGVSEMPDFSRLQEKPYRFIKKKRTHSSSFSHYGATGITIDGMPSNDDHLTAAMHNISLAAPVSVNRLPFGKNSKKSRNGSFKGDTRKTGSKDVWFRMADETDDIVLDHEDPDYDTDEADEAVFDQEKQPCLSDEEFESSINTLLGEFYEHAKPEEAFESLRDLPISSSQRSSVPYLAIVFAMQKRNAQCELTSMLLQFLSGRFISPKQMLAGFLQLLQDMRELVIDIPKAPEHVGRFVARAIGDEILPENFIALLERPREDARATEALVLERGQLSRAAGSQQDFPSLDAALEENGKAKAYPRSHSGGDNPVSSGVSSASDSLAASLNGHSPLGGLSVAQQSFDESALRALAFARGLLLDRDNLTKLGSIWGNHCGHRATKVLIKQIEHIISAFIDSEHTPEQVQAELVDMGTPHFHHEFVYQVVLTAMERGTEPEIVRIMRMLKGLLEADVVSDNQLEIGVKRVYGEMPLLQQEMPMAYVVLARVINSGVELGCIPRALAQDKPTKSRKRFVSEGDFVHRTTNKLL